MLKKIGRKRFLEQYPDFPTANNRTEEYSFPETYDYYILAVDYKSTIGLQNKLSKDLTELAILLGYNSLNFLGDTSVPWLYKEHNYNPVKRALTYLAGNNISKSFNGSIQVPNQELSIFLKNLFWLVRCNGVVNTPYFSDGGFNIIGNVCQYGNIHLSTLNKETDVSLNEILPKTGLYIYDEESCGGKRIVGRTIAV
jgi:hypothetical protein